MQYLPLSIVMATMAALSAALLGMGQENAWLPALTCLAAIGSVVLTDIWQGFRLNRYVANAAMILAAVFSLYGFLAAGSHQQLLAIGNLLIYVQIVLLFQRKSRRVYGQLVMFSLLQIVVAALLNHSLEFGLLLIVYVVLALSGGVLFFIYREADSVGVVQERRLLLAVDDGEMDSEGLSPLGGPPQIRVLDSGAALIRRTVAWRLAYPVAGMIGATLIFAAAFFFTTPRTGGNHWNQRVGGRSYVGFSPDVNYEELNRILTTDTRVMRVRFLDARTGEPYTVIGEPYLRGVVLTSYFLARSPQSLAAVFGVSSDSQPRAGPAAADA
jgi:protein-glutamine gamma-glutamyltransferase